MRRSIVASSVLVVLGLAGIYWWVQSAPSGAGIGDDPTAVLLGKTDASGRWLASDAGVDGQLQVNGSGELVINTELRRQFDYLLTDSPNLSLDVIFKAAEKTFAAQLKPDAAARAMQLFKQYVAYRKALAELKKPANPGATPLADIQALMTARNTLRRQYFSAQEADALFGDEEKYDAFTLARMEVERSNLSEADKAARIAQLEQTMLPEADRKMRQEVVLPIHAAEQVAAMRAQGASEQAVWQFRAQQFGQEAADRLASLDKEETDWQKRLDKYQQELQAIQARNLPEADANREIAQLKAQQFDAQEQLRVDAALQVRQLKK